MSSSVVAAVAAEDELGAVLRAGQPTLAAWVPLRTSPSTTVGTTSPTPAMFQLVRPFSKPASTIRASGLGAGAGEGAGAGGDVGAGAGLGPGRRLRRERGRFRERAAASDGPAAFGTETGRGVVGDRGRLFGVLSTRGSTSTVRSVVTTRPGWIARTLRTCLPGRRPMTGRADLPARRAVDRAAPAVDVEDDLLGGAGGVSVEVDPLWDPHQVRAEIFTLAPAGTASASIRARPRTGARTALSGLLTGLFVRRAPRRERNGRLPRTSRPALPNSASELRRRRAPGGATPPPAR